MTLQRIYLVMAASAALAAAQSPNHQSPNHQSPNHQSPNQPFRLTPPKSMFAPVEPPSITPHIGVPVAMVDLDGDGAVDLAMGGDDGPEVQLNRGTRFVPVTQPTTGWSPLWTEAGDVDGDGDVDLMQSSFGLFSLLLNDGHGTFTEAPISPASRPTLPIDEICRLVDLDGDGDLDLVTDMTTVMINDGQGLFVDETASRLPTIGFTLQGTLAVLDLEMDGDADFVTLAGVFRNDGHGTFTLDAQLAIGYGDQLHPCDMDSDGDTDLVSRGGEVLFVNDGQGGFSSSTTPARRVVAVADLDGDGWVDGLATDASDPSILQLFWGSASGWGNSVPQDLHASLANRAVSVTPTDLNGDGLLDIVVVDHVVGESVPPLALIAYGSRGFLPGHALSTFGGRIRTAEASAFDANGDGAVDLVGTYGTMLNDGSGRLRFARHGGDAPVTVHGDWDGDGDEDYLSLFQGSLYWIVNDGLGRFAYDRTRTPLPVTTASRGVTATSLDWDGDGDIDLVTLAEQFLLWTNDGTGALAPSVLFPVIAGVHGITFEFADFNRDGRRDVALALSSPAVQSGVDIGILLQQPGGGFALNGSAQFPYVLRLEIDDLTGDAQLDILASGLSGSPRLLVGNGRGGFVERPTALSPGELTTTDFDLDGDVDVVQRGAHPILWRNDGSGQFTRADDLAALGAAPRHFSDRILFVDLDGDGDEDMVHGGTSQAWSSSYNAFVYWNDSRHLRVPGNSAIGGQLVVQMGTSASRAQADPSLTAWAWADLIGLPRTIPGLGTVYIDPATAIFVGTAPIGGTGGSVELSIPIPTSPALVGLGPKLQGLLVGRAGLEPTGVACDWITR